MEGTGLPQSYGTNWGPLKWVCLSARLLGGFCNWTGGKGTVQSSSCRLRAPVLPPTSLLLLDCSGD